MSKKTKLKTEIERIEIPVDDIKICRVVGNFTFDGIIYNPGSAFTADAKKIERLKNDGHLDKIDIQLYGPVNQGKQIKLS